MTYFVSTSLNKQQSNIRLSEQTLQLNQASYADIGAKINKVFVFVADVGDYRTLRPPDVINLKREADRQFYMYKAFWSSATVEAYTDFMETAFVTYVGSGRNAQINSRSNEKRAAYTNDGVIWQQSWNLMFSEEKNDAIFHKYDELVGCFLHDIASSNVR